MTIDFPLAIKSALFFLFLMLFVFLFDSTLYWIFELSSLNVEKVGLHLKHFQWHFFELFSNDTGLSVFQVLAANKPGFLHWSSTYSVGFFLFLLLSTACYLYAFAYRVRDEKRRVPPVLKIILAWVIVKQLAFVFVIPPWQGPDEIYHYLYTGSFFKTELLLEEEITKSAEKFHFRRLVDVNYGLLPSFGWEMVTIHSNQPPVYYYIVQKILSVTGITKLPASIYPGRLLSSLFYFITLVLIYLIAKIAFTGPHGETIAINSTLFAATLPQISFISATMSGDAMINMFTSLSIFWIISSMDSEKSLKGTLCFIFLAFLTAILGVLTKFIAIVLLPALFVGGIIAVFGKWHASLKEKILITGTTLVGVITGFGTLYFFTIKGTEFDIISFRFNFDNYVMQYVIGNVMSGLHFKDMIFKSATMFVSFWVTYGWMVFKASPGTYILLFIYSSIVLWGLIKFIRTKELVIGHKKSNIFLGFLATYIIIFCYLFGDSQGRYFFIGISSLAIMQTIGLFYFCPERYRENSLKIVGGSLVLFNLISFFGLLVPVFYLIK